jgi:hypothetical protein
MDNTEKALQILKQAEIKENDFVSEVIYNTVVGIIIELLNSIENVTEQRDRLQANLIEKEEVNSELRQTIIAKQHREIRLETILAPHQELTQWIEEEMTCEPNSDKFEVNQDFLKKLFYKVVQINH